MSLGHSLDCSHRVNWRHGRPHDLLEKIAELSLHSLHGVLAARPTVSPGDPVMSGTWGNAAAILLLATVATETQAQVIPRSAEEMRGAEVRLGDAPQATDDMLPQRVSNPTRRYYSPARQCLRHVLPIRAH